MDIGEFLLSESVQNLKLIKSDNVFYRGISIRTRLFSLCSKRENTVSDAVSAVVSQYVSVRYIQRVCLLIANLIINYSITAKNQS